MSLTWSLKECSLCPPSSSNSCSTRSVCPEDEASNSLRSTSAVSIVALGDDGPERGSIVTFVSLSLQMNGNVRNAEALKLVFKIGKAGDRFGGYFSVNCLSGLIFFLQKQNSPNPIPKFRRLHFLDGGPTDGTADVFLSRMQRKGWRGGNSLHFRRRCDKQTLLLFTAFLNMVSLRILLFGNNHWWQKQISQPKCDISKRTSESPCRISCTVCLLSTPSWNGTEWRERILAVALCTLPDYKLPPSFAFAAGKVVDNAARGVNSFPL